MVVGHGQKRPTLRVLLVFLQLLPLQLLLRNTAIGVKNGLLWWWQWWGCLLPDQHLQGKGGDGGGVVA